jgi:hypothetical protein
MLLLARESRENATRYFDVTGGLKMNLGNFGWFGTKTELAIAAGSIGWFIGIIIGAALFH